MNNCWGGMLKFLDSGFPKIYLSYIIYI